MSKLETIRAALKALGVAGKVRIEPDGRVYVYGKYFGTYDFTRNTFVD